jgi:plastocyanin
MRKLALLATATAFAALTIGTAPGMTAARKLTGTVGPGFTITMSAKTVKAGTYTITIRDRSNIHNFHLIGPGINEKTSVAKLGTYKWTLKLKHGTYRYLCDPHATIMHGVLKVT